MVSLTLQLQPGHRSLHYGSVVLHISRDDLRETIAMQSVADDAEHGARTRS
jgi:hypothetical protein